MPPVGLFGKIPARGDFIRQHVSDPASMELVDWLQYAVDALKTARQEQPQYIVRFMFAPKGTSDVLIGALGPSRDKVGRTYPLVIFAHFPGAVFAGRGSRIPFACDPFLGGVVDILERAATLDLDQLSGEVARLVPPGPAELQSADEICMRTLQATTAREMVERLFAVARGEQFYAFNTLLTACQTVRGQEPAKAGTILDCPIQIDVDLFGWLEIAERLLRWPRRPPAFFWVEEPVPRLMISLGLVHIQLLSYLVNPAQDTQRIWPLTTTRDAGIAVARQQIEAKLGALAPGFDAPLGVLVETLERIGLSG